MLKYTTSLISPASGKMLKILFDDIMPLLIKATTVGRAVHKFSTNLSKYKYCKKHKIFSFLGICPSH